MGGTAGGGSKDRCTRRGGSSVFLGTAYHNYIASILRDASGGKLRSTESSDAAEPMFAYEDRKVPGGKRGWWQLREGEAEGRRRRRSEEHTSELQSQSNLVCR